MTSTSFGFQWTALSATISVVAMIAVCALAFFAWYRSGFSRSNLLLELSRIALVGFAVFLLNQPESVQSFKPTEKPTLVVLGDQSQSMKTVDVELSTDSQLVSRTEAIAPLLDESTWNELQEKFEIVLTPFAVGEDSNESDIFQALYDSREEHPNLRAVVLASDGDWNAGVPPVQATSRFRVESIPIFSVAAGSETRLPDLELISFDVPTFGVTGKNVRLPFTIESSLPRDEVATLVLKVSDGTQLEHQVKISAMGRTSDAIVWKPETTDDYTLELTIPPNASEKIKDNNNLEAPIAIREEKLKVLVVESVPRWEYRYLRNALSRDPGVEVSCLLFHPGLSKVGGGNRDYIPAFPDALDELSQYDVVCCHI